MANPSRPALQTPSEQARQAQKPEPRPPSTRPEPFDEYCRGISGSQARSGIVVNETTRQLNERRHHPRWTPLPSRPPGLMEKLSLVIATSDILTEAEKWAVIALLREDHVIDQRSAAIIRNLPPSATLWLASSGYVSDPFCVSPEALLMANALGDIERHYEHSGTTTIRELRAGAAMLSVPGPAQLLLGSRDGCPRVRTQYALEDHAA